MNEILEKYRKKKYANATPEQLEKIKLFQELKFEQYRLKTIKRSRKYPQVGDVFKLITYNNIEIRGMVINDHITMANDEYFLVIYFHPNYAIDIDNNRIDAKDLLARPQIVDRGLWTRGLFFNIDHVDGFELGFTYGFLQHNLGSLDFAILTNEYGKKIDYNPDFVSILGVQTIHGVPRSIGEKLILLGLD